MKVHVLETGKVFVSRIVPFGAKNAFDRASSVLLKDKWVWLPVFCYLIEHPGGLILVDTGWDRSISPKGVFDKSAQARSLGSHLLTHINQGLLPEGQAIDEQLAARGISPADLQYVLLTHLDCDHACGLHQVADAKNILVSNEELLFAEHGPLTNRVRYQRQWWEGVNLATYSWKNSGGPFKKSFDLFGDGSIELINIPGHSAGQAAVKVKNNKGDYVLIVGDGAYGRKSWEEMILPGISENVTDQMRSLEWIREQSLDPYCLASLASHDTEVQPHTIEF